MAKKFKDIRSPKMCKDCGKSPCACMREEAEQVDEREMTSTEMKKREKIAKALKPVSKWEKRYPGRGKEVMYATATKQAMKEDVEGDYEYEMARNELATAERAIERIMQIVGQGEGNLEAWVQSKITKACDYLDTVADYMESQEKTGD